MYVYHVHYMYNLLSEIALPFVIPTVEFFISKRTTLDQDSGGIHKRRDVGQQGLRLRRIRLRRSF
jgi:hypothetical protein